MPRDPLRYHRKHQSENVFGDSVAERAAEKVATGMGTVAFILVSTGIILGWVFINHAVKFVETAWHGLQTGAGFDPEPWILLNLIFSAVAFYTGALVIIAAKSEAKKSRATEEAEAEHREDIAQRQIVLIEANTKLTEAIHDLTEEVHKHILETT
jgi:uncharacterized membrane protein